MLVLVRGIVIGGVTDADTLPRRRAVPTIPRPGVTRQWCMTMFEGASAVALGTPGWVSVTRIR